ncbi:LysR family transcriptional regulator [Longispora fulva]|uniref:DNA-binding transcriptional LysR family regulator n=2 Tax=Longispora fulva TaxID=619741 RepID=A0A8J7GR27_9ACTN|nr:DNA-binding transcriptional LysR family regulator [Longispora fulva]GIG56366.1 LysR family transcriptional regulator [Longispora fulva]
MQLQQLRYFLAVAESRHFTQAAEAVGVTQPTLSKQIHTLESDLGAALFHRNRGAITLTEAGEALLPLAQRIVADAETARHEIGDLIGLRTGRLRLGATPSLCTSLVAETLKLFRDAHPDIRLQVEEGGSQDLVRALTGGYLDLALIILPESGTDPALHTEPLLTESLVVASASPLHHREMRITDLRHQDLVMFRPGYDLRDATLEACAKAGFTPTFAVEGGEMDAVLGFVEVGLGVALVPRMVLAGRPRLHATPLAAPGVPRTVALARRRDVEPSHAAKAFQDILLGYLGGPTLNLHLTSSST